MRPGIRVVVAVVLITVSEPFTYGQAGFPEDRIDTVNTTFAFGPNFRWSSEWTSETVATHGDKNVMFLWHFKDGTVGYVFNGNHLSDAPLVGYRMSNAGASPLEDINRNSIQPLTLTNFPVKVELYLGESEFFTTYVPQILIDTVCFGGESIESGQVYHLSREECTPVISVLTNSREASFTVSGPITFSGAALISLGRTHPLASTQSRTIPLDNTVHRRQKLRRSEGAGHRGQTCVGTAEDSDVHRPSSRIGGVGPSAQERGSTGLFDRETRLLPRAMCELR